MWYNYAAPSINTSLDTNVMLEARELEKTITKTTGTLYHCYYDLEKRPTFKGYEGLIRPVFSTLHIDLDSKDDEGSAAWEDTKKLTAFLKSKNIDFQLYFSGNKGFHVALRAETFGITRELPHETMKQAVKNILHKLKADYPTIDTAIFDPSRKFRAYGSFHEKSGLYKIRLTTIGIDYRNLTLKEIRELARKKQSFAYIHPDFTGTLWSEVSTEAGVENPVDKPVEKIERKRTLTKFKSFSDKKCIDRMLSGDVLPGLNRHDIEICLIVEMRELGKSEDDAIEAVERWGEQVYQKEPERIRDIKRQVRSVYQMDLSSGNMYDFGCFGLTKKAYCSARCKIYDTLSPEKRAQPLDTTRKQATLNLKASGLMPEKKSESEIADDILKDIGQDICKSNNEYFRWENTHWKRIDNERFTSFLHGLCINAYDNRVNNARVESLYRLLVKKIPAAPEENRFFSCSPDKFNFTDGTAHIKHDVKGIPYITMKPHDPKDWLAYCAPFPLSAKHDLPVSGDFAHYLESKKEMLGEDGMQALKQLFGAALIPYIPRIFFLVGDPDSGKSTAAILISHLLGKENISNCDPTSIDSFAWEDAIGKIANIKLELPKNRPINDNVLKEVRDKKPVRINRKGVKAVQGTLPFLHIYCCNNLPPSLEGNSGALNNRISMFNFKKGHINGFADIIGLGDWLWERDAGGVLEFAREGLTDLMANKFRYKITKESEDNLIDWQVENDPVKLFVSDVDEKEWEINEPCLKSGQFKALNIYASFLKWAQASGYKNMGVKRFYRELRRIKHITVRKTNAGQTVFWADLGEKDAKY